ncbi:MAG: SGNH/GDSL hydrolase family protein [Bacteroidota bacterium]
MHHRRSFIRKAGLLGLTGSLISNALMAFEQESDSAKTSEQQKPGLTFLFQGDSITDGNHGRAEWDLNHIMGHGYVYSIASKLGADFPERNLKFINRGVSGNKITDLAGRWQKDTIDLNPDVLSILVGINDSDSYLKDKTAGVSVAAYEEIYNSLLDQTRSKFPNVLFVLGEPFTLPFSPANEERTGRQLDVAARSAVVKKLALAHNAVFLPFQQVFDRALKRAPEQYWIWDHIHPTVAGHELMAREWLKQVGKRLKFIS